MLLVDNWRLCLFLVLVVSTGIPETSSLSCHGGGGGDDESTTAATTEGTTTAANGTAERRRRRSTIDCPTGDDVCKMDAEGQPAGCGKKADAECGDNFASTFMCTKEKGCCCTEENCNTIEELEKFCCTDEGKKVGDEKLCKVSCPENNAASLLLPSLAILAVSLVTLYGWY